MKKDFKYSLKRVRVATLPSIEDLININTQELKSGPGEPKESPPSEFLERKKLDYFTEEWKKKTELPKEFIEIFNESPTYEDIFTFALKHLHEKPSEEHLRYTQLVLNEIGRLSEGTDFLRSQVTQKLVKEFIGRGE